MDSLKKIRENNPIVFLWDNFGPMHIDRIDAVTRYYENVRLCVGIEEQSRSIVYDWRAEDRGNFQRITLASEVTPSLFNRLLSLVRAEYKIGKADWFLCNYNLLHILLFAFWLWMRRRRVFLMGCSKFDDLPRSLPRELLKYLAFLPFQGAIASGKRSTDYFRFLGIKKVVGEYNTLSISRIRQSAGVPIAPDGDSYQSRNFIIVARLVTKKNLFLALEAFALFKRLTDSNRKLLICGSGPLESALKLHAAGLKVDQSVVFEGFVQTEDVSQRLASSLALILPSIEEQFGNVVIEAQAMGLPVLICEVCGARDHLVRNWINGFVFEPDNAEGLAQFMTLLDKDEDLWRRLCAGATATSSKGDVSLFVSAVTNLLGKRLS